MAHTIVTGIYRIVNLANGKSYVGSSSSIRRRWYQHRFSLSQGTHWNPHLQTAWSKYGSESFRLDVLEECAPSDLLIREAQLIKDLSPEYNLATIDNQGRFTHTVSSEARARIRASRLGKEHSTETRQKMSKSAKARGVSKELRAAQKQAVTGRKRSDAARNAISRGKVGKLATDSHKAAVSEGLRLW